MFPQRSRGSALNGAGEKNQFSDSKRKLVLERRICRKQASSEPYGQSISQAQVSSVQLLEHATLFRIKAEQHFEIISTLEHEKGVCRRSVSLPVAIHLMQSRPQESRREVGQIAHEFSAPLSVVMENARRRTVDDVALRAQEEEIAWAEISVLAAVLGLSRYLEAEENKATLL
jgi:hypothetical protein